MRPYIISLSKIESSKKNAQEVVNALHNYHFEPILFEGTYGNDAERLFLAENRVLHPITSNPSSAKFNSPGVKGCFHSHYRLWELCASLNEPMMIFEDDVIFYRNFSPVEFTDVLVLSINYDWKAIDFLKTYLEKTHSLSTSVVYNQFYMPGASGYIIKPHTAKNLIETYKHTYLPADWAINSSICKITIHPQLMGRSKTMNEKESLTRSKIWKK